MTGSASVNVLNLGDFLNPLGTSTNPYLNARSGLMQVNFGSGGVDMSLGSGGADVSGSAMYGVAQGLGVYAQNAEIMAQAQKMQDSGLKENLSVGLRSIGSNVDAKSTELYNDIMSGKTTVVDNADLDATAKTINTGNGTKQIQLGKNKLSGEFDMSVLLAHEAVRDGVWDGTAGQQAETTQAALNHIQMAQQVVGTYGKTGLSANLSGEAELMTNVQQVMNDPKATTEDKQKALAALTGDVAGYDSSADYWKLMKNGTLVYDGKKDLVDENGNLLKKADPSKSNSQNIADMLGISQSAAQTMLASAWNPNTKSYNMDAVIQLSPEQKAEFTKAAGPDPYYTDLENYSEHKYGVVAQTGQPKDQPGYWSEYERAMSAKYLNPANEPNQEATIARADKMIDASSKVGYGTSGEIQDSNGIVTVASTTTDCSGFVSYLNNLAKAATFQIATSKDYKVDQVLKAGDVVNILMDPANLNHQVKYLGNDLIAESYEDPDHPEKSGPRYSSYQHLLDWMGRNGTIKSVKFYTPIYK